MAPSTAIFSNASISYSQAPAPGQPIPAQYLYPNPDLGPIGPYDHGTLLNGWFLDPEQLQAAKPEYIIIHSLDPDSDYRTVNAFLNFMDYELVHFSDGYPFFKFKRSVYERQVYFIFQRAR
jgi:hypothetical protein